MIFARELTQIKNKRTNYQVKKQNTRTDSRAKNYFLW